VLLLLPSTRRRRDADSRRTALSKSLRTVVTAAALPVLLAAPVAAAAPSQARTVPATQAPLAAAPTSTPPGLGHDRLGVRRGDLWILGNALDGSASRTSREGPAGWQPVAGDLDGDGSGGVGLFRDGAWQLRLAEGGPLVRVGFGQRGDQPVVGDWDGDGTDTIGVFRAGRWYLRAGNGPGATASRSFVWGLPGDVAVVGDWDADGDDDLAVRRGATWLQRDDASRGPTSRTFPFGLPTDVPVAGDWDHDGRDTPGLFRDGTWYLRQGSFASPSQTVRLGGRGDRPVVRRTQGLAPGVEHRVVRDPAAPWVAHVASVRLSAASSPETVLSGDDLRGTERLSTLVRRAGAPVGVNGDFFLPSGRPVHLYANDGRLLQTPSTLGHAVGLDAPGTGVAMGHPDVRTTVTARPPGAPARVVAVARVNSGPPQGASVAAYTSAGAVVDDPPDEQCYLTLTPAGPRTVRPDGAVDTPMTAGGTRCGGRRPVVPAGRTVLVTGTTGEGSAFLRATVAGTEVTLATQLGFPGTVDALGGGPRLVRGGTILSADVDSPSEFYGRHPRTAVGVTADGRLLLVVVDGRQAGYSRGMTMRELATLLQSLGAVEALNLDGGGSAEMVVNGVVASRPSGGDERPVSNALVVLPGADPGQPGLAGSPPAPVAGSLRSGAAGARDAGSTGGLADALVRRGVPVSAELRRTAALFRAGG
jgi:hypothetical protein